MKKFLIQILSFSLLVIFIIVIIGWRADGYTDAFYLRFTTPKKSNLIIGTSRAAQGLQPEIFKNLLNKEFFNYSFTVAHSPFGPIYLESIKKKLKKDSGKGVYIITVDPWSISSICVNPNDSLRFRENELAVSTTSLVNVKPNFQYLYNYYSGKYNDLTKWNNSHSAFHLNDDGWLETTVQMDSVSVNNRTNKKIDIYREKHLPKYKYSSYRMEYLIKTINFLKQYGKVYLVRLPIHPKIMLIEDELMPDFNKKIENLIDVCNIDYFELTPLNSSFDYTDGNHLYKDSGKEVSKIIANLILKKQ